MLAGVLAGVLAMAMAQDPLAQGLSGYWKLDETAGPAADSSGNGLVGAWSGGVSAMTPGNAKIQFKDPNCAVMDGSTSAISVPANPKLDFTGDFSIALWIYPTADASAHEQGLLAKGFVPIRNYTLFRQDGNTTSSRPAWQERFQGRMDEVRLYNRALTPAETKLLASGFGTVTPTDKPTGLKH